MFTGLMMSVAVLAAAAPELTGIKYSSVTPQQMQVVFNFNGPVANPQSFIVKEPLRLVLDFKGVLNRLSKTTPPAEYAHFLRTVAAVEDDSRTRVIFDLNNTLDFETAAKGKDITLTLTSKTPLSTDKTKTSENTGAHTVNKIDFHAEGARSGKVVIDLSDAKIPVDISKLGGNIVVAFADTSVPTPLQRRMDVANFSTPVQSIEAATKENKAQVVIATAGDTTHTAYQVDKQYIIDVKPNTEASKDVPSLDRGKYTGKQITLNFQDIKVRAVLQLLSDFTGLNMVVSDTVKGNVTLRLKNVPWDQALDIILKTRGLDKRRMGGVLLIAPAEEIAAQEKAELANNKDVAALEPVRSELIQINYAKASDLAVLLKEKNNSLMSPRGNVSVDGRTNTLWVQDIQGKLGEIRQLVHRLDMPVQQVLIEARVVIVDKNFERDLGIRWGITSPRYLSGTLAGANQLAQGVSAASITPFTNRLNVNLPASPTGVGLTPASVGLAVAKLGNDVLLDLELSALENEGRGEVISSPRLITANQQSARIESGEEIPYQEASSSGATATSFKKAVLSLQVTPQITPDNKVILSLQVNQDDRNPNTPLGQSQVPSILTKQIQTNVLVDNGQTVVLGGIYKQTKNRSVTRIPFLGSIPVVGLLFSSSQVVNAREELLIFVTPKIVRSSGALASRDS